MLRAIETTVDGVARTVSAVALAALVVIAGFVFAEGVSRWLLGRNFPGLLDIIRLTVPVIVTATFPAALLRRQHITIRFAGAIAGPSAGRALDMFGAVLLLACLAAISHQLLAYAADARANGDSTWVLKIPLAPTWYIAGALMAASAFAQVLVILRDLLGRAPASETP